MQAYEFNAVVHNGVIRIPDQYLSKLMSSVRVIVLSDAVPPVIDNYKDKFTAMKLHTKGFKFNREEANER